MLLVSSKDIFKLEEKSVISFIGYANFLKIKLHTLESIFWFVDGIILSRVFKFLNLNVQMNSFDFTGIAHNIFLKCIENNYKIHFIGGTFEELILFNKKIKSRYPELKITSQDGYESLIDFDFNSLSNIDICVYGLGSPLQEITAIKYKNLFKYSFTCGAFISQTSKSNNNYYNSFVIKYNLRWLYRIYKEKGHFMRLFLALLKINEIFIKSKKIIHMKSFK